jgi:hypothetical protein
MGKYCPSTRSREHVPGDPIARVYPSIGGHTVVVEMTCRKCGATGIHPVSLDARNFDWSQPAPSAPQVVNA